MRTILLVNASHITRESHPVLIGAGDWKVMSDSVKSCRVLISPLASDSMIVSLGEEFKLQCSASAKVVEVEHNSSPISIHLQRL